MSEEYRSPESYSTKEKWAMMNGSQRVQFIWDYYKFPILIGSIVLILLVYGIFRAVTHKDPVLFSAYVNVFANDSFTEQITDGFVEELGENPSQKEVVLYTNWLLSDDPEMDASSVQYEYAMRVRALATIEAKELDVALMDQDGFDFFAKNGYLMNIDELLADKDPALRERLKPFMVSNTEVLSDNMEDVVADPSVEYVSETTEYPMALDLSFSSAAQDTGYQGTIYVGIVGNSPRMDTAVEYLRYLFP